MNNDVFCISIVMMLFSAFWIGVAIERASKEIAKAIRESRP